MANIPPITNFVLYGSQSSENAHLAYQKVLNQFQTKIKTKNVNYFLANSQNLEQLLKNIVEPTLFYPLFLMEGIEYQNFKSNLDLNFHYKKSIVAPLSEFEMFLNCLFKDNKKTIFLMHGSSQYDNTSRHSSIINFGKNLGFQNFCFLEGDDSYQEIIKNKITEKESIEISPLFFTKGKHIQADIIEGILSTYPKEKWLVHPCLLERDDIINAILEIAILELQKFIEVN